MLHLFTLVALLGFHYLVLPLWSFIQNQHVKFKPEPITEWMLGHPEVPWIAVVAYIVLVLVAGPQLARTSWWLKGGRGDSGGAACVRPLFAAWNLFLALFSVLGAYYTVPHLLSVVLAQPRYGATGDLGGLFFSICHNPMENYYSKGAVGFWTTLFILSKIPELLDTVFLVLQKKPVIFLHWYHHVTVLLFCWISYTHRAAPGLWFAAMNFFVHSIMYSYYFFMAINMKKLVKPIAPLVTSLQLLQMLVGTGICTYVFALQFEAFYWKTPWTHNLEQLWNVMPRETRHSTARVAHVDNSSSTALLHTADSVLAVCHMTPLNALLGVLMYASYMALFLRLFFRLYLQRPRTTLARTSQTF